MDREEYEYHASYAALDVSILLGKTMTDVEVLDSRMIVFHVDDGEIFVMFHYQECCESVYIEDICGDISDLVGLPITMAECAKENLPAKDDYEESWTWVFYKIGTSAGSVTVRWYGSSNGYYGEEAEIRKVGREGEEDDS